MSIQEVSAEQFAELFHHYHHALSTDCGCQSGDGQKCWNDLPVEERNRMTAAARLALHELESLKVKDTITGGISRNQAKRSGAARAEVDSNQCTDDATYAGQFPSRHGARSDAGNLYRSDLFYGLVSSGAHE